MGYLFFQTWIWLLLAALLGLFIGWLLWRRSDSGGEVENLKQQLEECQRRCADQQTIAPQTAFSEVQDAGDLQDTAHIDTAEQTDVSDQWRPAREPDPEGKGDDLKRISGIGPVIEKTLNGLGIYYYRQIASFNEDNVKWVNNYLSFSGRIEREEWIAQARGLSRGDDTQFSQRYDKED